MSAWQLVLQRDLACNLEARKLGDSKSFELSSNRPVLLLQTHVFVKLCLCGARGCGWALLSSLASLLRAV
jgi:hypothetical protein